MQELCGTERCCDTAPLLSQVLPPSAPGTQVSPWSQVTHQHRGVSLEAGLDPAPSYSGSTLQGFASSPFPPLSLAPGAGPDTHKTSGEQIILSSWILQP